jgi:hypothetical protein
MIPVVPRVSHTPATRSSPRLPLSPSPPLPIPPLARGGQKSLLKSSRRCGTKAYTVLIRATFPLAAARQTRCDHRRARSCRHRRIWPTCDQSRGDVYDPHPKPAVIFEDVTSRPTKTDRAAINSRPVWASRSVGNAHPTRFWASRIGSHVGSPRPPPASTPLIRLVSPRYASYTRPPQFARNTECGAPPHCTPFSPLPAPSSSGG